ncbi:MAG: cytochrome c3 family protein [Bacteroidota bacterium]
MYIPPQIKRHVVALAVFIALFLLVRSYLVPASFGKYGHYRGDALAENAARIPKYSGQDSCSDCHSKIVDAKALDVHAGLACETCHGPGDIHVHKARNTPMPKVGTRNFCGICHEKNKAKRKENIPQLAMAKHYPEKNCIDCHNPHAPWELKK